MVELFETVIKLHRNEMIPADERSKNKLNKGQTFVFHHCMF